MIRKALVLAAALPLCGCFSVAGFHLPHLADKPAPAASVAAAPTVCPASITADLQAPPDVPDNAKLPAIETGAPQDLQEGFASYTGWLTSYAAWAKAGWGRVAEAQHWCGGLAPR